jgi:hypothetical protein
MHWHPESRFPSSSFVESVTSVPVTGTWIWVRRIDRPSTRIQETQLCPDSEAAGITSWHPSPHDPSGWPPQRPPGAAAPARGSTVTRTAAARPASLSEPTPPGRVGPAGPGGPKRAPTRNLTELRPQVESDHDQGPGPSPHVRLKLPGPLRLTIMIARHHTLALAGDRDQAQAGILKSLRLAY